MSKRVEIIKGDSVVGTAVSFEVAHGGVLVTTFKDGSRQAWAPGCWDYAVEDDQ